MAYSDYGAFTWRNGERRRDKEDVGVYDTDEGELPSGYRIFANIMKNRESGATGWHNHSHHGVMGDGFIRVGLYKQGLGSSGIYVWPDGTEEPVRVPWEEIIGAEYPSYEYGKITHSIAHGMGVYQFTFTDKENTDSGHYEATMTEPDGTEWLCVYDYGYGAGLTDLEDDPEPQFPGKREAIREAIGAIFGDSDPATGRSPQDDWK